MTNMFGFPNAIHKNFNKNFLKTIIFQVGFDEISNFNELKEEITSIFGSNFPRVNQNITTGFQISFQAKEQSTPILQQLNNEEGLEMKSADGQKVIFINKTTFSLTISGKGYSNFEALKDEIAGIDKFFSDCKIAKIKKVAIRKINIVEFKISSNPSVILEHIISADLLSNLSYFPKSELIKQNIHTINYVNDDYRLNLKYGLNVPPAPNKDLGQIIIDIDLINVEQIDTADVLAIADTMNQEIFNVFSWAVSENTLILLDEKNRIDRK